ncbi:MAG: energy transducer TonB [Acidobacteriota bacterium]
MFDKLVVSSVQRRTTRTSRFFICTSITYLSVVASAFALSICFAEPKMADANDRTVLIAPRPPAPPPPRVGPAQVNSEETSRQDFTSVLKYDEIVGHQTAPPRISLRAGLPNTGKFDGVTDGDLNRVPDGTGNNVGVVGLDGKASDAPPQPPDPPRPTPRSVDPGTKPLRVTSTVLQGKVIERRVPVYPELVRRMGLQGNVAVEVMISPEGRVESARAMSGHPMLIALAVDAARGWRFGPTLLNGVPVRVTG